MMQSPIWLMGFALGSAVLVLIITLCRHKRLDRADAGSLFVAMTSGFTIPKGIFLCSYLLDPDLPTVPTKLHGYEKEIFAAGAVITFLALASIWSLCEKAYEERSSDARKGTQSQPAPAREAQPQQGSTGHINEKKV